MKKGFTLLEITIVVTLLIIIAVSAFIFLNPFGQVNKTYDAQRKHDLDILKKALEDWYNDKGCYPKPDEICYDDAILTCTKNGSRYTLESAICFICGDEQTPNAFKPYMNPLPCDPEHAKKKYLYEVIVPQELRPSPQVGSCQQNVDISTICPTSYKVYSDFYNQLDKDSINLGCIGGGCGLLPGQVPTPSIPYGYEYGISSSNTPLQISKDFYCYKGGCQSCGYLSSYQNCVDQIPSGCDNIDEIYSSLQACIAAH